ncbi:hypothetical protein M431DRAFT_505354, partial [Trichoderma harzianum CBS 226.95]
MASSWHAVAALAVVVLRKNYYYCLYNIATKKRRHVKDLSPFTISLHDVTPTVGSVEKHPLDASNRAVAGATATNSCADVRVAPCNACFRVAKCGTSMGLELIRRLHLRTS